MKRVRSTLATPTLLVLVVILAFSFAAGQPERSLDAKAGVFCLPPWPCPTGTWMAQITIPAGSPLGNPDEITIPEMVTFGQGGGVVVTPTSPFFPFPTPAGPIPALVSTGHANWKWARGGHILTTNWRFLSDAANGDFLGFVKIYVDFEFAGRDVLVGDWYIEVLEAETNIVIATLGPSTLVMNRLPVERIP